MGSDYQYKSKPSRDPPGKRNQGRLSGFPLALFLLTLISRLLERENGSPSSSPWLIVGEPIS